ncbi:hypothetical protein K439DRAFT_1624932 [Ramaria rubella]|nr:hypothetical protein K439DRAFT_1624932 [Ramaria rubella]
MNELRAQNRCFECEQEGHLSKDCPKRQQVHAPTASRAVIFNTDYESRYAITRAAVKLGLFAVQKPSDLGSGSPINDTNGQLFSRILSELKNTVPFVWDYYHVPSQNPYSSRRFDMSEFGGPDTFLLIDFHNGDKHVLTRNQLTNPAFNFLDWLFVEKCDFEAHGELLTGFERHLMRGTTPEKCSGTEHEREDISLMTLRSTPAKMSQLLQRNTAKPKDLK